MIGQQIGRLEKTSPLYETEPWGKTDQEWFYNQVIEVATAQEVQDLMKSLLSIEEQMGRKRAEQWAPRAIDLDILYFNEEVIDRPGLQVPHPRLHERRFTLEPLAQLFPLRVHPVLQQDHQTLLSGLKDPLQVRQIKTMVKEHE